MRKDSRHVKYIWKHVKYIQKHIKYIRKQEQSQELLSDLVGAGPPRGLF